MNKVLSKSFPILFCLFVFSMPLSMAGMELFSWTLFTFWLLYRGVNYRKYSLKDLWVPGLPFLLIYFGAVLYGAFTAEHFTKKQSLDVVGDSRVVFLIIMYFDLFQKRLIVWKNLFYPLSVALLIVTVFGIFQFFMGNDPFRDVIYLPSFKGEGFEFWRVKGFYSTPMTFGNTMAIWFILLLSLATSKFQDTRNAKMVLWILVFMSGLGFIFSFVRGAWLGVFLSLLFMTLVKSPKKLLLVLLANLFIAGTAYFTIPPIQKRMNDTISRKDSSVNDRFVIWNYYFDLIKKNPILGVGHRFTGELMGKENILTTSGRKTVLREHAHNNFLQILAGAGLVGFLGFYGFFMFLFIKSWRKLSRANFENSSVNLLYASLSAAVCFHFSSFTEATILDWEVVHLYALAVGLILYALKKTTTNLTN